MNHKKFVSTEIAPFKRNKGKGSLRWIDEQLLTERKQYLVTLADMRNLANRFNQLRPTLRKPGSINLCLSKKTIVRHKKKTDFDMGIERIYLRWMYYPMGITLTASIIEYPEAYSQLVAQFSSDGHKILFQYENERLTLLHRMRRHIDIFLWLTEMKELSLHNRSENRSL